MTDQPDQTDQPIDFGQYLQSRRRAEGISLTDVARRTKISMTSLRQIESADWANLPSPIFVKGFIKAYADAVGADPKDALDRYAAFCAMQDGLIQARQPDAESTGLGKRMVLVVVLLTLLIGGTIFIMQRVAREAPAPDTGEEVTTPAQRPAPDTAPATAPVADTPPAPPATAEVPPPAAVAETPAVPEPPPAVLDPVADTPPASAEPAAAAPPPDPAPPVADAPPASAEPAAAAVATPDRPAVGPTTPASPPAAAEPAAVMVLRISALETTWLSVASDENPPREAILAPGERITLEARTRFELVIGNAGGVRLELDDQPVTVPGRSGQVVRLRLPPE